VNPPETGSASSPASGKRLGGAPLQPKYEQVYDTLAERLAHHWRPGSRLPSERALCASVGVSRLTLRRALSLLEEHGLVERREGRGWYAASGPLSEAPNELVSFTELAFGRGLTPTAVVLRAEVRDATIGEAEALRVAPGAPVFDLERLRLLDGIALAVDSATLSLARAPFLLDVDFSTASLHKTLEEHDIWPTTADYTVEVLDADARLAELLGVRIGKGLLLATGTTFDHDRNPIETGSMAYRPDRYRLQTRLVRAVGRRA
jgi:GntR family transcriptional regulator